MTKYLVTGTRQNSKGIVQHVLNSLGVNISEDEFIIGGAPGVDNDVKEWCDALHIKCTIIRPLKTSPPYWYLYRNVEMIAMCDKVIAFWDGKSTGTAFTINYAHLRRKPMTVFPLDSTAKKRALELNSWNVDNPNDKRLQWGKTI